jgi:hypothetical protein
MSENCQGDVSEKTTLNISPNLSAVKFEAS